MDQIAFKAVTSMLTGFPQSAANPKVLLLSYEPALTGVGDQAICEAAARFSAGDVQGQSKTFAPSIAEFVAEARKRQEYIDMKTRESKPALTFYHHTGAPFHVRQESVRTKYRECAVLAESVGLDEYRRRCTADV